jgi:hypothetical protein
MPTVGVAAMEDCVTRAVLSGPSEWLLGRLGVRMISVAERKLCISRITFATAKWALFGAR